MGILSRIQKTVRDGHVLYKAATRNSWYHPSDFQVARMLSDGSRWRSVTATWHIAADGFAEIGRGIRMIHSQF